MAKLSFLEHIFSITNYGYHKQICIMGIKIRIYDNERYKNFYDDIPVQNKILANRNFGVHLIYQYNSHTTDLGL